MGDLLERLCTYEDGSVRWDAPRFACIQSLGAFLVGEEQQATPPVPLAGFERYVIVRTRGPRALHALHAWSTELRRLWAEADASVAAAPSPDAMQEACKLQRLEPAVSARGPLPADLVRRIFCEACPALEAVWRRRAPHGGEEPAGWPCGSALAAAAPSPAPA